MDPQPSKIISIVGALLAGVIGGLISATFITQSQQSKTVASDIGAPAEPQGRVLVNAARQTEHDTSSQYARVERRLAALEARLIAVQNATNTDQDNDSVAVQVDEPTVDQDASQILSLRARLIENGFDEQQADWVLQQRAEAQGERLQAIYQARRQQARQRLEAGQELSLPFRDLRDRLGDASFERYLAANGLPTSIEISDVLGQSAAAVAGLQSGDRITHYDGERVFNVQHLNNLTVVGEEGETVLIEIERDGNPIQLNLPRGPIGIRSGG